MSGQHGDDDEEMCWICLDDKSTEQDELLRPCKCPRWVHAHCMARWQLQCSGRSEEDHCKFCNQELPNWRASLFKDIIPELQCCSKTPSSSNNNNNNSGARQTTAVTNGRQTRVSDPGPSGRSRSAGGSGGDGGGEGHDEHRRSVEGTAVEDTEGTPPVTAATGYGGGEQQRAVRSSGGEAGDGAVEKELGVGGGGGGGGGELGSIKGDIIVKFNGRSFRCKVKTGQDGLEDFMRQIRQKCGIPEEKMASLNLTYRCKDPNTGSQMTLEGINESAFDAAVLCSAAQDKLKQQKRQEQLIRERERRRKEERQRRGYVSTSSDEDQAIADYEHQRARDTFPYPDGVASAAAGAQTPQGYNISSARDRRRFERISSHTSIDDDYDGRLSNNNDDNQNNGETAQQQQQQRRRQTGAAGAGAAGAGAGAVMNDAPPGGRQRAAQRTYASRFTVPSFTSFWRTTERVA